jgi:flagellar hook-length control protein FliK
MPNKTDGSIAPQMNALNQRGDAPLSVMPLRQVALQLTRALDTRVNHLTFQLDPEHLGKVDIELKIMNDNHVQAIFHVDNPESYELLRKDSAELQALLSEAGFESNADDFSFNYRDPNSESGERESSFLSSARTRQHEMQEAPIEGSLDVQPFLRRPDPSKTLDTLI